MRKNDWADDIANEVVFADRDGNRFRAALEDGDDDALARALAAVIRESCLPRRAEVS